MCVCLGVSKLCNRTMQYPWPVPTLNIIYGQMCSFYICSFWCRMQFAFLYIVKCTDCGMSTVDYILLACTRACSYSWLPAVILSGHWKCRRRWNYMYIVLRWRFIAFAYKRYSISTSEPHVQQFSSTPRSVRAYFCQPSTQSPPSGGLPLATRQTDKRWIIRLLHTNPVRKTYWYFGTRNNRI